MASVQLSTPEAGSVPAQPTVIAWLYQPFASGTRVGLAATAGAAASNSSGKAADAVFPAWSVQLPLGAALALSGPVYVTDEQPAIPEVASLPIQAIATALLYQPL